MTITSPARRSARRALLAGTAALLALGLAACSSSDAPSVDAGNGEAAAGANVEAAKAAIAPYLGQPTAFPVDQPLSSTLPAGTEIVFLQCGTPVCGLVHDMLKGAVEAVGAEFTAIDSGTTASTAQAAAASALALAPDAVIITGIDPAQYGDGLRNLSDAGVKVVSMSVAKDVEPYGVTQNYMGAETFSNAGAVMANWVIAREGDSADVVFYTVPALDFSGVMYEGFQAAMAENCPSCKIRSVEIDIMTIGTTAPQTVVTDLQANPNTNTAVFASYEAASGLPSALGAAGIEVSTIGFAPTPGNLTDIGAGDLTAGFAVDFATSAWTAVDLAARLILGDEVLPSQKAGDVPAQLLEQDDIDFDPSHGWSGYPDFPERFMELWGR